MKILLYSVCAVLISFIFSYSAHAATYIVQPGTDPIVFKDTLNKLRVAIMKLHAAGVIVPISVLATAGYDYSDSTDFTLDLTEGMEGPEVVALQSFLIRNGYAIPGGVTGKFSKETKLVLQAFQSERKILPSSGYFGPITRAYIKANPEN